MSSVYYPDQRFLSPMTIITREVLLPEEALGKVSVQEGQMVDIRETVAKGLIPERHVIINAAQILGLKPRDYDKLRDLMLVQMRTEVNIQDPIAGKNPGRGKRVFAPINGIVRYVGNGRIIMQERPNTINLQAGVRGKVVRVYENRGVAIEATGALIQGVWGNGHTIIAMMRLEPPQGLTALSSEGLDVTYKGEIVVTSKPLDAETLRVAEARGIAGLIAPSMDATLIEHVIGIERAILLTEGFGSIRMSTAVTNLLREFDGQQATLDAYLPKRWEPRRPEVVVNRQSYDRPPAPDLRIALRAGMRVRINREPLMGQLGKVLELPKQPILLDNGLSMMCAKVELTTGVKVDVPLANIELAGRS